MAWASLRNLFDRNSECTGQDVLRFRQHAVGKRRSHLGDANGRTVAAFLATILMLGVLGATLRAQDATGRIIGNVTDASGSSVPGAQVVVANSSTKIARSTVADGNGFFQVLSLPIGEYDVSIEKPGFKKVEFLHQALQIGQSLRLDAQLTVGQEREIVEVSSQAANIETVNQTVGATVTGETIQRAPLNGRNVLDLAALQPGVTETNADSGAAGNYSIAGGRSDSVTYLLDGAVNNDLLDNGVVFNPNPDTIAEFRIMESNYSAEYGRNGGGIISVVTKSGSNEWHGSAFEFLRNDAFNANTFFNKVQGLPRNVLKRNQYGGTIGGPIKHDKFFFFVGYQGQRLSQQEVSGLGPVYTPQEIQGNFSQAVANNQTVTGPGGNSFTCAVAAGCPDPNVVAFLQDNPYFAGTAGNAALGIMDPSRINPVTQKYLATGLFKTDPSGQANYQGAHTDNNNEITAKLDFALTQKDKLSVTLGGFRNPVLDPFNYSTIPGFPNLGQNNNYLLNGTYYRTFTPNVVNEFRAYTQRNWHVQDNVGSKLPTAAQLGTGVTPDNPTGPPNIYFDNGFQAGFSVQGPTTFANNTFGFLDTVTWIRGRHNFKFGGGLSAYQNNTVYDYYVNGEFDFYSSYYGASGTPATGNPFADFLLGAPSQLFQYPAAPSNIRSKAFASFFQDEWRVTKTFTLNLGIRYEYSQPKLDTKGRSFSIIPGLQSTVFVNAPVGMVFPGDKGAPVGTNFPDKNNWAPRIGFAWDPKGDGKTSLRGGFGIFYDVLKGEDNLQFNGQPPFFASTAPIFPTVGPGQSTDIPFFSDPFGSAGVPNPFPSKPPASNLDFLAAGFLPINAAGGVYVVDPHLKTPYTYQYNLSLQRELAKTTVFEVSYVGSSSHGLTGLQDINPFILGTTDRKLNLTPGNSTCTDSSGNTTSGADPAATCSFAGLPEFRNVTKASYNGLEASVTRQISDTPMLGRTYFTFAYTFAHSIDNVSGFRQRNSTVPSYGPDLFRASSDQDVRHRITFSGGWDLPFDHMWNSGPKRLTQGWSIFPIFTWHTGFPFDVFAHLSDRFNPGAEGPSGAGDPANVHPNVVGSLAAQNPRQVQDFGNGPGNYWFNPNSLSNAQCPYPADPTQPPCVPGATMLPSNAQVVADPSLSTYGTLPRNYFRGPGYINFDMAFSKTTALTEKSKLEFRAEFFNLFNHANFTNPGVTNNNNGTFSGGGVGVNINSSQFGQITSTYDPRIIQLALRLSF
jgi:outer membrane receptor protein involved in Fe transport